MTRRLIDFARGLLALTATLALLIGVPTALAVAIGWPLPTELPPWDVIQRHITDADIPDSFVIKTLATIVWLAWAQLAVAIIIEFAAAIRGRVAGRAPVMPGMQLFAARLATWVTLMTTALGPVRPVLAAPLQAFAAEPAAAQVVDLDHTGTITTTDSTHLIASLDGSVTERDAADGVYVTVVGDSWWDIAQRLHGHGMRWKDIRNLNLGHTTPSGHVITETTETIRPGWQLRVPPDANPALLTIPASTQPADHDDPTTTDDEVNEELITVEKGDHFWALAKEALAEAWGRTPTDTELTPYWADMVDANRDRLLPPEDPDLIYPQQHFIVPAPPPSPDIAHDVNGNNTNPTTTTPIQPAPIPPQHPTAEPAPPVAKETASDPVDVEPAIESPPVASAPTTAVTSAPEGTGSESDSSSVSFGDIARPAGIIASGLGLLGGLITVTLRRLRHIQAARRRPGSVIEPPDEETNEFEQRIRAIGTDGEDVRYITAANSYLAHQLNDHPATDIPSLIAMRAGQYGLELLLDEPCKPVDGFIAAADDWTAWRLHPDTTARHMEAEATHAHPFAPALLVVGHTDAGNLLVDVEQLGAVAIEGSHDRVTGFQRGLIASAIAAPWATECRIVAIGIDGLSGEAVSRVETPTDPDIWTAAVADEHTAIATNLRRSPYEERINHGEVYHPTLVFIGPDPSHAAIAQHLAPVAALAYAPLAVVAASPILSEYRIPLEADTATLEPLGATFQPVQLEAADLVATDRLVAHASDTATSPPTSEWAEQIHTHDRTEPVVDIQVNGDHHDETGELGEAGTAADVEASEEISSPSSEILEQIGRILAPQHVEVTLLGRSPTVEGTTDAPSPKLEAIIAYLAFHREVASQRLREEFWPASTRRQAADNAIGKVRTLLGRTPDGQPRLDSAINSGTYTLTDDIGCDWHRAQQLITLAKQAPPAGEAAALDAACELIQGRVGVDAPPANYAWLLNDSGTYTQIETALVDAAHRRGELALTAGDIERANWAARKGLQIVEGQEALYRIQMRAAAQHGDTDGIKAAYREAQRAAESYGYDEEVQPETQALYSSLTGNPESARLGSSEPS